MTKVVVGAIVRDLDTPPEKRRYLVTLAFWRSFGGNVEASRRDLWFTEGHFERWPKAKTWLSFEEQTAKAVAAGIAKEWGEPGPTGPIIEGARGLDAPGGTEP